MSDNGSANGDDQELDLSNSDVVTKYKASAEITNKAIAAVIAAVKEGASVLELCKIGDDIISKETAAIFKGKSIEKGIAFPTCVSLNSVVGHFSPLPGDETTVKEGDVVKIDLGSHIDGFIATQSQTLVVGASSEAPATGRAADVIQAARTAFDVAVRLIKPGKKVSEVSEKLAKAVEPFGCQLVEGVMSHQMKQHIIDGNKCVLNRPSPEHRVEEAEFEPNEVYAVDIVVSTGEGKPKMLDERETTVYKRDPSVSYQLKLKASRAVFSEINKRAPAMPFSLRALLEDPDEAKAKEMAKQMRLGLTECVNHGLLHPYPVMHEKAGELVAQVKGTLLLMPNGNDIITSAPVQLVESSKLGDLDAELAALLKTGLKVNKKSAKKAAKKAAGGEKKEGEE